MRLRSRGDLILPGCDVLHRLRVRAALRQVDIFAEPRRHGVGAVPELAGEPARGPLAVIQQRATEKVEFDGAAADAHIGDVPASGWILDDLLGPVAAG